jgi:hypothetical protein
LIVRNGEQINNAADITVNSSGVLDLETFNTNESIGSLVCTDLRSAYTDLRNLHGPAEHLHGPAERSFRGHQSKLDA